MTEESCEATFDSSRECFEELLGWLGGDEADLLDHGELEEQLDCRGRELLRRMYQDRLDQRAANEDRLDEVRDAQGTRHGAIEAGHARPLSTIFGTVIVTRFAYRHRGHANLYPADGQLNLPQELHSHGLRRLAAVEAARGSFEEATEAISRVCGQKIGKRQAEALAASAAVHVEEFYASRQHEPAGASDVLVISADGKGIVMRPESLRPATAAKAEAATNKLECRLSKGEKRNRKRLAEVGAVYDITPAPRTASDIMSPHDQTVPGPEAKNKWLTASVVDDAAEVVAGVFDEAERRDPGHERTWVALVDGNNHQIERIQAEAAARSITITVVIDCVHVLEYLWGSAWCFYTEGDPAAEIWVRDRMIAVLEGNARAVAAGLRRRASAERLSAAKRKRADEAARYLTNKANYLDYPNALAAGWPIATGVIEGACRHLVKDRMDLTGARWSTEGAEAILKLRAIRANGDFQPYWRYHREQQRQRLHGSRYANGVIPAAA
jgi:hypothetical protein